MKYDTFAISTPLLCASLLLSLSPACGKNQSSNSQTPEPSTATAQTPAPSTATPPTPEPATPNPQTPSPTPTLSTPSPTPKPPTPEPPTSSPTPSPSPPTPGGSYTLDDLPAATKTVNEAIEAAVKEVVWPFKGQARDKLKKTNLPPPQRITISYTSTEVSITTDRTGTIQTPADGGFVDRTILGDKLKVSTKWSGDNLERTFKGGDGERVNTYSLGANGKTLNMHVKATGGRLGVSVKLVYVLRYKRTS
jgi:hypothetical protein